jgi:hypothetical protein
MVIEVMQKSTRIEKASGGRSTLINNEHNRIGGNVGCTDRDEEYIDHNSFTSQIIQSNRINKISVTIDPSDQSRFVIPYFNSNMTMTDSHIHSQKLMIALYQRYS